MGLASKLEKVADVVPTVPEIGAINPKIRRLLAKARAMILAPLERTEDAEMQVGRDRRRWSYAPVWEVQQATSDALRAVGLEFFMDRWTIVEPTTIEKCPAVLRAEYILMAVGGDLDGEIERNTVDLEIGSRINADVVGVGTRALLEKHVRLSLLDLPCVPKEEADKLRAEADSALGKVKGARIQDAARGTLNKHKAPCLPPQNARLPFAADDEPDWMRIDRTPADDEQVAADVDVVEAELAGLTVVEADPDEDQRAVDDWRSEAITRLVNANGLMARAKMPTLDIAKLAAKVAPNIRASDLTASHYEAIAEMIDEARQLAEAKILEGEP